MNNYRSIRGHREYVMREHTVIAENILGKKLPLGAEVHHVDCDKSNNTHHNLVICPNRTYHKLLHTRQRALDVCGNANWIKCVICKQYDEPKNLTVTKRKTLNRSTKFAYHKSCKREENHKYSQRKVTS